jgi:3-oxoacyl-[acyl-carrier protein] reductase
VEISGVGGKGRGAAWANQWSLRARRNGLGRHSRTMLLPSGETPGGRVAIVAGGSRGIGRETVLRLTLSGYAVAVGYAHDQRAAESIVETVLARDGAAVAIRADVTDDLDVERLFAETVETFGGVDVVVHAVHSPLGATPVAEADLNEFDELCRMTFRATLIVNREAARRVGFGGAIVNLSASVPGPALPTYGVRAATTTAIYTLTRALALELRERDITVNVVALEVDKTCAPQRAADVIAYLSSDQARVITGQVICIDNRWRPGVVAGPGAAADL